MALHCEGPRCPGRRNTTFFCQLCACDFCEDCWSEQLPHQEGRKNRDAHEPIDRHLDAILELAYNASSGKQERYDMIEKDVLTKWFNTFFDKKSGRWYFQNHDRYAELMLYNLPEGVRRYPHIVSFVGETGVGKSSIIKLLIDLVALYSPDEPINRMPTPVVSAPASNVPTTSSVHLYADPATSMSENPILFADMEGLRGGEINPAAEEMQRRNGNVQTPENKLHAPMALFHEAKQLIRSACRPVVYADTPETQSREFMVTQLYPRLLYTFSDVVVFVTHGDFKKFESVLGQLLDWARHSIERSVNQPMLPHVIIVSNFTSNSLPDEEWDVALATKSLLDSYKSIINSNSKFRAMKEEWKECGVKIKSIKRLLRQYYSSISVVRIPQSGRPARSKKQMMRLRDEIQRRCIDSFCHKQRSRFMLDADLLQTYLHAGFEHFTTHQRKPFNFMEIAMQINPISKDFSGNVLHLAVLTLHLAAVLKDSPGEIFDLITRLIASCILLDISRSNRLGDPVEALKQHWHEPCDEALQTFVDFYWPCSFKSYKMDEKGNRVVVDRCTIVKRFHRGVHQNENGRFVGSGEFDLGMSMDAYRDEWHRNLQKALLDLDKEMPFDKSRYYEVHRRVLRTFYAKVDARRYKIHSACMSCLHAFPEHPLPCGHIMCTKCVESHTRYVEASYEVKGSEGIVDSSSEIIIRDCPLHKTEWAKPYRIHLKPPGAGVRVLSLEGGGVRGIVVLKVLKALSSHLPEGIKPQHFFDLIVGSNAGGFVAVGLGVKDWTVTEAIDHFTRFIKRSFPQKKHAMVEAHALISAGAVYKTAPIEDALKQCFGYDNLFGGSQNDYRACTKVAVTVAVTDTKGQRGGILTNYNRKNSSQIERHCGYAFERANHPKDEIKQYQAVRATCATPYLAKPFDRYMNGAKRQYMAGDIYHPSPAELANQERKLIYADTGDRMPDIHLSIAPGDVGSDEPQSACDESDMNHDSPRNNTFEAFSAFHYTSRPPGLMRRTQIPFNYKDCKEVLNSPVEAQLKYETFARNVSCESPDSERRYKRISPKFPASVFPEIDRADQLEDLQEATRNKLKKQNHDFELQKIAEQLVASSFYFDRQGHGFQGEERKSVCKGRIRSTFPDGSENLRRVGRWLGNLLTRSFVPHFLISKRHQPQAEPSMSERNSIVNNSQPRGKLSSTQISGRRRSSTAGGPTQHTKPLDKMVSKHEISEATLRSMTVLADLNLDAIQIPADEDDEYETVISLVLDTKRQYPISGFPAKLLPKPPPSPRVPDDHHDPDEPQPLPDTPFVYNSPSRQRPEECEANRRKRAHFSIEWLKHLKTFPTNDLEKRTQMSAESTILNTERRNLDVASALQGEMAQPSVPVRAAVRHSTFGSIPLGSPLSPTAGVHLPEEFVGSIPLEAVGSFSEDNMSDDSQGHQSVSPESDEVNLSVEQSGSSSGSSTEGKSAHKQTEMLYRSQTAASKNKGKTAETTRHPTNRGLYRRNTGESSPDYSPVTKPVSGFSKSREGKNKLLSHRRPSDLVLPKKKDSVISSASSKQSTIIREFSRPNKSRLQTMLKTQTVTQVKPGSPAPRTSDSPASLVSRPEDSGTGLLTPPMNVRDRSFPSPTHEFTLRTTEFVSRPASSHMKPKGPHTPRSSMSSQSSGTTTTTTAGSFVHSQAGLSRRIPAVYVSQPSRTSIIASGQRPGMHLSTHEEGNQDNTDQDSDAEEASIKNARTSEATTVSEPYSNWTLLSRSEGEPSCQDNSSQHLQEHDWLNLGNSDSETPPFEHPLKPLFEPLSEPLLEERFELPADEVAGGKSPASRRSSTALPEDQQTSDEPLADGEQTPAIRDDDGSRNSLDQTRDTPQPSPSCPSTAMSHEPRLEREAAKRLSSLPPNSISRRRSTGSPELATSVEAEGSSRLFMADLKGTKQDNEVMRRI